MKKKIIYPLLLGLFLVGCAPAATQPSKVVPSPTEVAAEPVSQQLATPTSIPTKAATATETATPISTPDFSLIGLPSEEDGALVFDFVEQMCNAEWYTRGQDLSCPGDDSQSSAGYVMQLDGASQGLSSDINVLLAYTPQKNYETISSKYPTFTVQKGDRFRAVLACKEHTFCDVEFVLDFSNEKGSAGLKSWRYLFADEPIVVDYPLDALAGETVQFHLNVRARGNPVEAYAVWIAPHIYRPAP
ncbi:MAG: hypothetical protein HY865_00225 [Chloroflexi bacterium]|nr:hypothetical protein [Chloroflexota bacterium]